MVDLEETTVLSTETLSKISTLKGKPYVVAMVIGGARVSVGLQLAYWSGVSGGVQSGYNLIPLVHFRSRSIKTILTTLNGIAGVVKESIGVGAVSACVAAAGRVPESQTSVEMTNYEGTAANQHLGNADLPSDLFPMGHTRFVNNLAAGAYGASSLSLRGCFDQYFSTLFPPNHTVPASLPFQNHLVLRISTGLGMGLLMALPARSELTVLPLEGGHTTVTKYGTADPEYDDNNAMMDEFSEELYGGKFALEFEDVCSGKVLVLIYKWLKKRAAAAAAAAAENDEEVAPTLGTTPEDDETLTAAVVVDRALAEEEVAVQAVMIRYRQLARASANLAVQLQAKGVIWEGHKQVVSEAILTKHADVIRKEFYNHPKGEWLHDVPLYLQTKDLPLNMEGAVYIAHTLHNIRGH
eukprot:TRINITY_DN2337_c1_g1_i3.p1 TRINITY_DN2337_c1_g1~~TRINITY_DN2337_c1_g1_i3.p1  ORF type:complete len:432 (+),score=110.70 TRINITY_DN2337_c1_g1_i3:69-1298(+)